MADLKQLNQEQITAITAGAGPLLIIAGAGTGKTTVITERIKHLILEKKVNPANILALTFTEKAAKEMQERVDIALPYGYTDMWINTFHAFCDRVLRDEAIHIGLNPTYTLATEAQSIIFLRKHLFDLNLNYFRPLGNPNKFLQGLLQHFSRLKDEDITPEEYVEYATQRTKKKDLSVEEEEENNKILELANAYQKFEELKIKEGLLDFGDLIAYTLKLFRERKHILKQYQDAFTYILIDEFQDTNYAQNQLAILLAGNRKNITVVGDDDQAIYRWRGAAISNMIQFRKTFPDVTIVTLNKNYRSTSNILDTSYQLIQCNNPDRLEVKEKINKKLSAQRKVAGNSVEFIYADRGEDEANSVVEKIEELIKKGKYTYKDFAILVRANDHATPFLRELDYKRIPYQFLGPGQLFQQEVIKDLIAYLKVLVNFEDSTSLYRVLTMPIFKLSATDIAVLLNESKKRNITLFEILNMTADLRLTDQTKEKLVSIEKMIRSHFDKISKESAGQILYAFLQDSGLLKEYMQVTTQDEQLEMENVAKFFERIKGFESGQEDASVFAVVDWIDLSMQLGESPLAANTDWAENNAVNILTIHSSKGLEFPIVFVVNLVTQRFPSRERKEQIPLPIDVVKEVLPEGDFHLQEERRLCYVAMTRARDILYLSGATFYGEGKRERKLSPFIYEALGLETVEKIKEQKKLQQKQLSLADLFPKAMGGNNARDVVKKPVITYLSFSQIQTFQTCPLHYKLRYLLNIPTPQTPAQAFGTSVHSTLKDFYHRAVMNQNPQVSDILTILKENWIYEGYGSKEHEHESFNRAQYVITDYLKKNYSSENLPIALEVPFQFWASPTLRIGGRIDRIDRLSEDQLEIIDYKTGNNVPDDKEIKKNFQLTLYGLAATEIKDPIFNRKPEEIVLSLYYLEEGKKISTTRTREQLEEAKKEVVKIAEEIANSDFACSRSIFCENCEYKMLCSTINL